MVDDRALRRYGDSDVLHVSQDARRQAEMLLQDNDDCDFDADTADQVLQVIVYGQVVFA